MNVKVFDISTEVIANVIDETQKNNILKIFEELTKESHLITNCFLNLELAGYDLSPIYYFNESENKSEFDYNRIAEDLLKAESKTDNTRNSTIREGLLFIKSTNSSITIMKLEKLEVIDKDSYEIKSELGKEKDYFKVCTFNGNYDDIKIIDKNRTAAKYWYQKFLGLTRKRTPEDNTKDVVNLLGEDKLFQQTLVDRDNYDEVKRFTEYYLFDNKKFDKSDLFNELNSSGLIELKKEDELYSEDSKKIDSDFYISEKAINQKYQRKIQTSPEVTVETKNYLESLRDNEIIFNENNKTITIMIDEDYLNNVKEKLEDE
ncbi:hypothetical protein [Xylanivirga thermophila]|uniref:hypothetical protein n=1 Tax=Xylanivirga thermophila TaxID=2496273 RepID=UPI00101D2084|nr:hypothetical protein [Xylanivirga thermophila]